MGMQLRVDVAPLPTGNAEPSQLRADFDASTPEQRVAEAMALSQFLTELSGSANSEGNERGPR